PSSIVTKSGRAVGTLPTSTRSGYIFKGWWTTSASSGGTQLTANTVLYARTPRTYKVVAGDSWYGIAKKMLGSESLATQLASWNGKTLSSYIYPGDILYIENQANVIQNRTYYARWSRNNITFYFNGNGGSDATAITKPYYSTVGTLPTSYRTGYTFKGWFITSAPTGGSQLTTSTLMTTTRMYYAR